MTVTVHADDAWALAPLMQDLRALARVAGVADPRRAVHGSGVIVADELALLWLTLTLDPSTALLESLAEAGLVDIVGRRAPREALASFALSAPEAAEPEAAAPEPPVTAEPVPEPEAEPAPEPEAPKDEPETAPAAPAESAPKAEWVAWARAAHGLSKTQANAMNKTALWALASVPAATEEG